MENRFLKSIAINLLKFLNILFKLNLYKFGVSNNKNFIYIILYYIKNIIFFRKMKHLLLVIVLTIIIVTSNGQYYSSHDGIFLPRNGKRSFINSKNLDKSNDILKLKDLLSKNLNAKTEYSDSKENEYNDTHLDSENLNNVLYRFLLHQWIKNQY